MDQPLLKSSVVRLPQRGGVFLSSFFLFSGGWGKIKLKLTTLPRIVIHVVCRFNSIAPFADGRLNALTLCLLESLGIRHEVVGAMSAPKANYP